MKRNWCIQGYDGLTTFFKTDVNAGQFSDEHIKQLLQALTAKYSLTDKEIVGAYANRRTKIANNLREVLPTQQPLGYKCGSNPWFAAYVQDESGKPVNVNSA
jgi:hypothetical protein